MALVTHSLIKRPHERALFNAQCHRLYRHIKRNVCIIGCVGVAHILNQTFDIHIKIDVGQICGLVELTVCKSSIA